MNQIVWSPLYGGGFMIAFFQASLVYYVAAYTIHFVIPKVAPVRSVQKGTPTSNQIFKESFNSLGPLAVKAGVWTVVERMHEQGVGLLYSGPVNSAASVLYILFSIVALDYLHDTWFYWTHRLLHWGPLFRNVHYVHHRSIVPTAFTGYSFHIVEAAIVFANEVLVCFLLPLHMGLHRIYHILTTIIHNGGHAGYEIAPFIPSLEALIGLGTSWMRNKSSKNMEPSHALNTVRHHDMHHRHPKVHFSLYMTHWDRLMGTEHPDYKDAVARHFASRTA